MVSDDVRWRGATASSRTEITWPDGSRSHDGAYAPPLTKQQALDFLRAVSKGHDPIGWAEGLGIESFSLRFSKTTYSYRGRPTKHPRWCVHIIVDLCPNRDEGFFRRPLDGLPDEAFRGL